MFQPPYGPVSSDRLFLSGRVHEAKRALHERIPEFLRLFLRYAGWRRLTAALATIVLGALLEGLGILILVQMVQLLLVTGTPAAGSSDIAIAVTGLFAAMNKETQLTAALAIVAFAIIARGGVLTLRDTLLARLQHGFVEAIKLALLEQLARARWEDVVRHDRSVLVQMLGSEMMQLARAVHYGLSICVAIVFLIAMSGFAIYLVPTLAMVIFAFLGALFIGSALYLNPARTFGDRLLDEDLAMSRSALRFVDCIKLAKAHGLQRSFVERYSGASHRAVREKVTYARLLSASRNGLVATGAVMAIAAMVSGTLLVEVPPLQLIAFVVILSRLCGPALSIQQGMQQIAHSVPRFEMARQLTRRLADRSSDVVSCSGPSSESGATLEIRGMSFDREIDSTGIGNLADISLVARSGEVLGLRGPSGAGKTTLLDLICGLLQPTAGSVRIDGSSPSKARSFDGVYLGHEAGLYAGSLRDNMLWFAPDASDLDLREALLRMGGGPMLQRMQKGLDTWLVDGGGNLSAGERQRVALARAILRRPKLILLDEATNSLDRESEASVLHALRSLPGKPTIILVSHRIETLSACDRIVEMSWGRLMEPKT